MCLFLGLVLAACEAGSQDASLAPSPEGRGGSLARFAIAGDHLYIVDNSKLHVYNITDPANPLSGAEVHLGVNIETIFPYDNKLFIGSQTGMHIYDRINPNQPKFISRYDHVMSCDPVVVQGNYAYVTLRSGTDCRLGANLLDVIDISNPYHPKIVNSYSMINPHGL
ncbi:MAG: hypothetical protein HC880_20145, partial [Bacteroidia bacterium]|nr:hypothetical protein [Bacteroidia bacterium]